MPKKRPDPNAERQPELPLWTPAIFVPQGDNTFLVKPGKPVSRISVRQFAQAVGIARTTAYQYLGTESVPERFLHAAGPRLLKIDSAAIEHFNSYWRSKRGLSDR